jgi:hypothetical protein
MRDIQPKYNLKEGEDINRERGGKVKWKNLPD